MRVITGKARGVQLKTPDGMLTRPTADRVKEALFSMISSASQDTVMLPDALETESVFAFRAFAATGAFAPSRQRIPAQPSGEITE